LTKATPEERLNKQVTLYCKQSIERGSFETIFYVQANVFGCDGCDISGLGTHDDLATLAAQQDIFLINGWNCVGGKYELNV